MSYNTGLADRVRAYLADFTQFQVQEKKMFGGLAFLVNDKMCVNVTGEDLMCRFDPVLEEALSERKGYLPMIMQGRQLKGYCCVEGSALASDKELKYWIDLCLDFNKSAKPAEKKRRRAG